MSDDNADDSASSSLPPPDDRLWRHPSEIGAGSRAVTAPASVRSPRRRTLLSVAVLAGVTGAAVTVAVLAAAGTLSPRVVERRAEPDTPITTAAASAGQPLTVRMVAAKTAAAVVSVSARVGGASRRGSGLVVRADGLLVTSAALVDGASAVTVTWGSGRMLPGRLLGTDDLTGLAVLRVDATALPVIAPAPAVPDPGDLAVTVGGGDGPRGSSVTQGVVSAVGSHAQSDGNPYLGLIETDQPVPTRADGGALVVDDGRVAGVCLRVGTTAGWAVPVDQALRVADDIARDGRVTRGWMGVTGADAVAEGTAAPVGARLLTVAAGSPADEARLAVGDVVEKVDGEPVRQMVDLQALLAQHRPGDTVTVTRNRAGARLTVPVRLIAPS